MDKLKIILIKFSSTGLIILMLFLFTLYCIYNKPTNPINKLEFSTASNLFPVAWGELLKSSTTPKIILNEEIKKNFSQYSSSLECYKDNNNITAFCYLDKKFVAKIKFIQITDLKKIVQAIALETTQNAKVKNSLFKEENKTEIVYHQSVDFEGITYTIPKNKNLIIIKNETLLDQILFDQEKQFLEKEKIKLKELLKKSH